MDIESLAPKRQAFCMDALLRGINVIFTIPFLFTMLVPGKALAFTREQDLAQQQLRFVRESEWQEKSAVAGASTKTDTLGIREGEIFLVTASAYASQVSETDGDPFTTAAGTRTRLGVIAANWLPLGSRVKMGNAVYIVEDRMNSRFDGTGRVDIWMTSAEMARQFGVHAMELTIVSLPEGKS